MFKGARTTKIDLGVLSIARKAAMLTMVGSSLRGNTIPLIMAKDVSKTAVVIRIGQINGCISQPDGLLQQREFLL